MKDLFFFVVAGTSLALGLGLFFYMSKTCGLGLEKRRNNPEYIRQRLTEISPATIHRSMWLDGMFIGAYCTFFGSVALHPIIRSFGSVASYFGIFALVSLIALTAIDVREDSLVLSAMADGPDSFQSYAEKLGPVELWKVITLVSADCLTIATLVCIFS